MLYVVLDTTLIIPKCPKALVSADFEFFIKLLGLFWFEWL